MQCSTPKSKTHANTTAHVIYHIVYRSLNAQSTSIGALAAAWCVSAEVSAADHAAHCAACLCHPATAANPTRNLLPPFQCCMTDDTASCATHAIPMSSYQLAHCLPAPQTTPSQCLHLLGGVQPPTTLMLRNAAATCVQPTAPFVSRLLPCQGSGRLTQTGSFNSHAIL
jgi:hypothetical protein